MHRMLREIKLDWLHNPYKYRIRLLLILFRICTFAYDRKLQIPFLPILILYRIFSEWVCSIELRPGTSVGAPLIIDHGFGLVINKNAKLGKGVHLRHGVTIGVRNMAQQNLGVSPVIGDNVEFGCYVSVLGDVKVSENVKLGAHSLVLRDVGPGEVFMGYSVRDY